MLGKHILLFNANKQNQSKVLVIRNLLSKLFHEDQYLPDDKKKFLKVTKKKTKQK